MIRFGDMGQAWGEFRRHWKLFLAIHVTAGLFVVAVLGPALTAVLGWLVLASGDAALTDQDILRAFLSPLGFALFLVGIALVITVAVFETAALMVAAHRVRSGKPVRLWRLGRFLVRRFRAIFLLALRMTFQVVLLAVPFLAVAGWAFLHFLTEYDINYYLSNQPPEFWKAAGIIGVVLVALAVLLYRLLSGWVLALPLLLFGHGGPSEVLAMSRERVAPRRGRVVGFLLAWSAVFAIAYLASGVFLDLGTTVAMGLAGASLELLAWLTGGLFVIWSVLNFAIGLFAGVSLVLGILMLYETLGEAPPEKAAADLADLGGGSGARMRLGGVAAALLAVVIAAGAFLQSRLAGLAETATPDVIAHRGASWEAPENTLASIQAAIDQGADWAEIDVQETREGRIVVIHDRDLMKVAGSPLAVWDTPLEELQAVDIGSYRDTRYADQRVPLLEDVLELARGRIRLNIELKYYGEERRLEERVAELVEAHGMEEDVVLMSLSLPGVRAMKALRPNWTVGLLSSVAVGDVTRLDVDFFAVNARFASRSFVDRARERGKAVYTWTVNDAAGLSAMMSRGVDGIITDRPALAREVMAQRAELDGTERLLVQLASALGSDFGTAP